MGNNTKYDEGARYNIYVEKKVHDLSVKRVKGVMSFSALVNDLLKKFNKKGRA
jgi:hypothetical protein